MRRRQKLRLSPPQTIALVYAVGMLIGGLLLALPVAHAPGADITPLQALFTSTSAICITGLVVVGTGQDFNLFGQIVILLLIQLGGLGIITFGTVFASILGRRVGVGERLHVAEALSAFELGGIVKLLRAIFASTLIIELIGALILYTRFGPLEGWGKGAYYAVFYSISAFNNAGFTLYPDSLVRFEDDPVIVLTIMVLVLLGGLGFLVFVTLVAWRAAPRKNPLTTHTKIVLSMHIGLLIAGAVAVGVLEWSNPATLGPLTWPEKLMAAVFQSSATRSSGFNTVDIGALAPVTQFLFIMLMFIGAGPSSTGGGIKVTTFFVMALATWSIVRGRGEPTAFRRRIDSEIIVRSLVVTVLSFGILNFMLMAMVLVNPHLAFIDVFFETMSAFATVGLSTGVTPVLTEAGQALVILMMYLGRIGPLTLAIAIGMRARPRPVSYPADPNIAIG